MKLHELQQMKKSEVKKLIASVKTRQRIRNGKITEEVVQRHPGSATVICVNIKKPVFA